MVIHVDTPAFNVMLTKLVDRTSGGQVTSAAQSYNGIDLTPYLGTAGVIRTIKNISAPAGGFSITFADQVVPEFSDTAYAICEPMDYIEIRGSRQPQNYVGQQLPILMAGFVSTVDRAEAMGSDGTPVRTVTVAGHDTGKLLEILHVYWETMVATDTPYLDDFHLQAALGMDVASLPVSDFMTQIIKKIVNPKIQQMSIFANEQVKPFTPLCTVPDGLVVPQMWWTADDFTMWDLVYRFADRPFNEVFSIDTEQGPQFIFRPSPFKDLMSGAFVMDGAADPGMVATDISDVVAMTVARTDSRVANLFVVDPGSSTIDANARVSMAALQAGVPLDFSYPANAPALFGVRKMKVGTNLQPATVNQPVNMLQVAQQGQAVGDWKQWFAAREAQLKAMNRDNATFEDTGAVLKGRDDYQVGLYWQLTRGDLLSTSYINSVSHNIQPMSTWTTSIHTTRGDGFYRRNLSPVSPYFGEGRQGPYSE